MLTITMVVAAVRAFFEVERQRPRRRGLAVVAVIACTPLAANLLLYSRLPQGDQPVLALATGTQVVEAPAFALAGLVIGVATPVFFWLLYTGIAYGITARFDGEGSYARYATLFAWGLVPGLVLQLLWLGSLVANALTTAPPADPSRNAAWLETVQSGPAMAAVELLYPVTVVAAFALWVVATAVGRRVATRQAVLAVLPALAIELATFYLFVLG